MVKPEAADTKIKSKDEKDMKDKGLAGGLKVGEFNAEGRSFAGNALYSHTATMQLGNTLHYCQSKSGSRFCRAC